MFYYSMNVTAYYDMATNYLWNNNYNQWNYWNQWNRSNMNNYNYYPHVPRTVCYLVG